MKVNNVYNKLSENHKKTMASRLDIPLSIKKDFNIANVEFENEKSFNNIINSKFYSKLIGSSDANDAFIVLLDSSNLKSFVDSLQSDEFKDAEKNLEKLKKLNAILSLMNQQLSSASANFKSFGDTISFFTENGSKIILCNVNGASLFESSYSSCAAENRPVSCNFNNINLICRSILNSVKTNQNVHFAVDDNAVNQSFMYEFIHRITSFTYEFNRYKAFGRLLHNFCFYMNGESLSEGASSDEIVCSIEAQSIMKTFANYAPNELYPESYAAQIKELLEPLGVKVSILKADQLKELGMYSIYSVGKGSVRKPCAVFMEWNGPGASNSSNIVSLVGKGVTFDTGGISIKPANKMEEMKFDMSGSACVVGSMYYAAKTQMPIRLVGGVGLAENMPGGNAMRPGDVISSMSGQTIEVQNTDAEGRLVLADILWYVQEKFSATTIVDLATLTGAIVVSLGSEYAGVFSNDDKLCDSISSSGDFVNEKVWRLPMNSDYDRTINSRVANMKNISSEYSGAGSITAAQFLQRFIQNGNKWAHIDIAGVAYKAGASSGFGVRLLSNFLRKYIISAS